MKELRKAKGFAWTEADSERIQRKGVTPADCERLFFSGPHIVRQDLLTGEPRYYALGTTERGRDLFVVFTLKDELVRVISAGDMSGSERREYGRVRRQEVDEEGSPEVLEP